MYLWHILNLCGFCIDLEASRALHTSTLATDMKTSHSNRKKIDRDSFPVVDAEVNLKTLDSPLQKNTDPALQRSQILIAESDSDVLQIVSDVLFTLGYGVEIVSDSAAVLAYIQVSAPILILLNIHLPDLGGNRLCELLKTSPRAQNIPIIFLGDSSDPQCRDRAFAAGGADYLLKPFGPTEVLVRIRHQLTLLHLHRRVLDQQILRADSNGSMPLLASLQKRLREQSQHLQTQNNLLQHEILERQQAETALREAQQKSDQLLLNILPAPIAEKLKQGEGNCAERFDQATILFADIVNFTSLASNLAPLTLVNLLNEIFSAFDRLAQSLELEKIKTIGDAYMVAGGVPLPRPDHAEAVVEMAIAMRQEIKKFSRETNKPLRLRIGINTGAVVAGVIGLKKFSYDLWGDAVNVASRMESQGLPGKIQVTEETYHLLQHKYCFEQWGKVNIKGKGEMTTYLLVGRQK